MSALPIITEKYNIPLYRGTIGEKQIPDNVPNGYYEKILSGNEDCDCIELQYFDICTEIVENFFENTEDYAEEFEELNITDIANLPIIAKIKDCLLDYIETERNKIGVALINDMSDDEYRENYKKIFDVYPDEK